MSGDQYAPNNYEESPEQFYPPPAAYTPENAVDNIVAQIDPQNIIDNLDHALKGESFKKETGEWAKTGEPLVNENCRGWTISYLTGLMNNSSTMATIDKDQFSNLMRGIIRNVTKTVACNVENFGFVPPSKGYKKKNYRNKGSPDRERMDTLCEMILQRAFMIYTRSLMGMESRKIFQSLSMTDNLNYGPPAQQNQGWVSKMFR